MHRGPQAYLAPVGQPHWQEGCGIAWDIIKIQIKRTQKSVTVKRKSATDNPASHP